MSSGDRENGTALEDSAHTPMARWSFSIKGWTGIVATVAGLAGAVASAMSQLAQASRSTLFVLAILLLFVGLRVALEEMAKHSVLVNPSRFGWRPLTFAPLVERREAMASFLQLLDKARAVNLTGDGGVGKTVFIKRMIIPALEAKGTSHLYCDLAEASRAAPECPLRSADEQILLAWLAQKAHPSAIPLLILDGVDDYVSANSGFFFPNTKSAWLNPHELQAAPFWKNIAEALEKEKIKIVLVARSGEVLQPFQISLAETFPLFRMRREEAELLLEQLCPTEQDGKPVILYPEKGWNQLKKRLLDDLQDASWLNPRRLCFLLRALPVLRRLNPGEYNRSGGIQGIVSQYLAKELREIAAQSQWSLTASQVAYLLNDEQLRYRNQAPWLRLNSGAGSTQPPASRLPVAPTLREQILTRAMSLGLIQRIGQPAGAWRFVDSLVGEGLQALTREKSRWEQRLQEGEKALADSTHVIQAYGSLLGRGEQLSLFFASLMGRERLGGRHQRYLRLSLWRWPPLLIAGLLMLGAIDAGAQLPLAPHIRQFLDRTEWTVFRRPTALEVDQRHVQEAISTLQKQVVASFSGVRVEEHLEGMTKPVMNPWAQCQALSALIRSRYVNEPWMEQSLNTLFDRDEGLQSSEEGKALGWFRDPTNHQIGGPATIWCAHAVVLYYAQLDVSKRGDWRERYAQTLEAVLRFHRDDLVEPGEWNLLPNQASKSSASVYTSALALQLLLEMRAAELEFPDRPGRRDALITQTHNWLKKQREEHSPTGFLGWKATADVGQQSQEGLTLQVFATLLRAREGAHLPLGNAIALDIPKHITSLAGDELRMPLDTQYSALHQLVILAPSEKAENAVAKAASPSIERVVINFFWYPWSISATSRWLAVAHRANVYSHQQYLMRRSLGILLQNTGDVSRDSPSVRMPMKAELLYTLVDAKLALNYLREPPPGPSLDPDWIPPASTASTARVSAGTARP